MSFAALAWAVATHVGNASDKLLLLALADRHNTEHGLAYPSIAWLTEFTSLDRKTVIAALDRLEAAGLIEDSGTRVGKTKQVKAYRLNLNDPNFGTVAGKSTVFPMKESQKRDTEPVKEPETRASTTLQDEWAPSAETIASIKTKFALDDDEIEAERIVFILKNQANETQVKNADAAFAVWCSRRGGLAHPPPAPRRSGGKAQTVEAVVDVEMCKKMIRLATDPTKRAAWTAKLRELEAERSPPLIGETREHSQDPAH